jgi:hypothetical protein
MKALSVICSIMITAVPSVLLAQNKPYPDFDFIAKTAQPAPQNESSPPQNEPSAADHPKVTRPGPVTPSARMNAPYPPEKEGCHHLVDGKWQEVPCISEEHIKDFPPPKLANSIQSTPHGFIFFGHPGGYTSPLVWGSVAINNSLAITGPGRHGNRRDCECIQYSNQHQLFQLHHVFERETFRCRDRRFEFRQRNRGPRLGAIRLSELCIIRTSLRVEYRFDDRAEHQ